MSKLAPPHGSPVLKPLLLEGRARDEALRKAEGLKKVPPEWYGDDQDALFRLFEHLLRRRGRVSELLLSARHSVRQPFPNWK